MGLVAVVLVVGRVDEVLVLDVVGKDHFVRVEDHVPKGLVVLVVVEHFKERVDGGLFIQTHLHAAVLPRERLPQRQNAVGIDVPELDSLAIY